MRLPEMPIGYRVEQGYDDFMVVDHEDAVAYVHKEVTRWGWMWVVEWLPDGPMEPPFLDHLAALSYVAKKLEQR